MKNKYLQILVIFIISLSVCNGQNKTDSLKKELLNAKHDTTKLNILVDLIALENDEEIWPRYNKRAYTISVALCKSTNPKIKLKGKRGLAEAINNLGFIYMNTGKISEALEKYYQSLKLLEELNDKAGVAVVLSNIGTIYENQGDIPKALENYHKSFSLRQKLNDNEGMANSLNALGTIYENQGDTSKAFDLYRKSVALRETTHDKAGLASAYNNLAYCYDSRGNLTKALYYYDKSFQLYDSIGDKRGAAYALNNLGTFYSAQNNNTKAIQCYEKGLKVRIEIGDRLGMAYSYKNIGSFYLKLGDYTKAETNCLKAFQISSNLGFPENIRDAAYSLLSLYKIKKNPEKALEMFDIYIKMRDSINNAETDRASVKSQFKYEYDKKAAADSVRIQQEKKLAVTRLKQEQTMRYTLYGGLSLTLVFGIFMFNRFRVTRNQKYIIENQKKEVEMQKELVDAKQKEVIDSIHYAKRIQNALLPQEKYIEKKLSQLNKKHLN